MITVVTGGSGSGKSAYAEELIVKEGKPCRYYIAAMKVYGEEGRKRVERHRLLRRGKGFTTIEKTDYIEEISLPGEREKSSVLLECLSNLAANEFYIEGLDNSVRPLTPEEEEKAAERICQGILGLSSMAEQVVIVTNEIFSDGLSYDADTLRYIGFLGKLNRRLAAAADQVIEVVYQIPVVIKGGRSDG